jgi:hypothetical protein
VAYRAVLTDPGEGRAALIRLWTSNLHVRGDAAAKLDWLYLDGPAGRAQAFVLQHDDAPVGCAGITVRELWYRDRPLRAALLADFAVDRAHRTGFPALVLQRTVKRHVDGAFDLSYGFPNDSAVAVHRRIGYHELGGMNRYVRVLRHGGYLERRYGHALPMRALGAVVDAAKLAVRVARAARPATTGTLRWQDDVDPRFDQLWQATRGQYGIACRRDAAFLRWRFLRKPGERNAIATLCARGGRNGRGGDLRAYAIVGGTAGGMAELLDVYGPLDAISDLFTLLMPALYARRYTAVGFRFLGDPRMTALLEAHHFSLRDHRRTVVVHEGTSCPIDPAVLRDRAAWYLTDLDEDT